MLLLGLDLAVCTGFCLGRPGETPRSGSVRVKQPAEALYQAPWNLETFLQDLCLFGDPDLIVYEAPIPLNAQMGDGRARNEDALLMPIKLEQAIERFCLPRQIRWEKVYAATVRKHLLGKANYGDRQATKNAVFDRCKVLGLIPSDARIRNKSSDPLFDQADACAVWSWACAARAKHAPSELFLHGERPSAA